MPMPTKNTATIIRIIIPFCCGDLELTAPQLLFQKFLLRLVILESPLGRRWLTTVNASPRVPVPLRRSHFKTLSDARRTVIIDRDTFHANARRKVRRPRTFPSNRKQI
jgi:hypothetical protein